MYTWVRRTEMEPDIVLWLIITYLLGSLPWSVWLSVQSTGVDPRTLADGNPGATNAFRVAGKQVGLAVLLLDFLKAFLPVVVAKWIFNLPEAQLFWIALAPMIGHAFSVFLRLRGGRGITTMFGVWSGLTLYEAPVVLGITAILVTVVIKNDELKTILLPIILSGFLLLTGKPYWMIGLAIAQLLIILLKITPFYFSTFNRRGHMACEDNI